MRKEFEDILEIQRKAMEFKPPSVLIHGPPKCGKTHLAGTASIHWKDGKPTSLDDMLWVAFDNDATQTFSALNIDVPHLIDWGTMLGQRDFNVEKALLLTCGLIREIVKETPTIRYIVTDTISMLDTDLNTAFKPDPDNPYSAYREILNCHRRLYNTVNPLRPGKIYLCHSQVKSSEGTGKGAKQAKQTKEARHATMADIVPQITGAARTIYIGSCSGEMVVRRITAGDGSVKRVLYPHGFKDMEGGSRWESKLSEREEPDLTALFKKVNQ